MEAHRIAILMAQLFYDGADHPARPTPGRPEIDHHRLVGVEYYLFKLGIFYACYCACLCHLNILPYLILRSVIASLRTASRHVSQGFVRYQTIITEAINP